ncbi:hypothetical protein Tco_0902755 [Tanacetum coccineum]
MCISMNLPKDLTSVQNQFRPRSLQQDDFCVNSTELELTCFSVRRSRSALVVPIPPVVPITPVNVPAAPAPENANGSPSTTVISEGAPAVTDSLLPHQIPLPDTSDSDVETLFDHVDSHVFDHHNAPDQRFKKHSHSTLSNIYRPVSYRKPLDYRAMWSFFNEFLNLLNQRLTSKLRRTRVELYTPGSITACLVVKGYRQEAVLILKNHLPPVARLEAIRLFIAQRCVIACLKCTYAIIADFRYLKGTISHGSVVSIGLGFELKAFADADYAGCHCHTEEVFDFVNFLDIELLAGHTITN